MKVNETRYPRLTRDVLKHLDNDQLSDVVRHGANAGFPGFTCTRDTCNFYRAHKADILKMAEEQAQDLGEDMLAMISHFNCLSSGSYPNRKPDYSQTEIAQALYDERAENADTIRNAMAWYALEEVARELNPAI